MTVYVKINYLYLEVYMKLVLLIGDGAVGKMTVGQELAKITGLRLFHNHISIEPVLEVFGEINKEVIYDFRESVFRNFSKSDKYGLIFTFIWDFDSQEDWDYIAHVEEIFKDAEIYCVELVAPLDVRLQRNVSENRLKNKASKRDIEASNKRVINCTENYRVVSRDGEVKFKNYFKLDNSNISASDVAKMIKERFSL